MNRYYLIKESDFKTSPLQEKGSPLFPPNARSPLDTMVKSHQENPPNWSLFSDLLTRYLQLKNTPLPPPSSRILTDETKPVSKSIKHDMVHLTIEGLPTIKMQKKAKHLFKLLQQSNKPPFFDEQGTLLHPNTGEPMSGTNIVSLVTYLFRERAKLQEPNGWMLFSNALKNNPSVDRKQYKRLSSSEEEDSSDDGNTTDMYETPRKLNRDSLSYVPYNP